MSGKYDEYETSYDASYSTNTNEDNPTIKRAVRDKYQNYNSSYLCHTVPEKWKFDTTKINRKINCLEVFQKQEF